MSRQERLVAVALSLKGFQFACHIHLAVFIVAYIKRYHADGVTGYQELVALSIVKAKSEDAAEIF